MLPLSSPIAFNRVPGDVAGEGIQELQKFRVQNGQAKISKKTSLIYAASFFGQ
jgi:hypothetical protein